MPDIPQVRVNVVTANPIIEATMAPKLFWPTICSENYETVDQEFSPNEISIRERNKKEFSDDSLQGSTDFWLEAFYAKNIYIMDPHLDENVMSYVYEALKDSNELERLMVFCGKKDKKRDSIFQNLKTKLMEKRKLKIAEIKHFKKGSFPFLHDRFVVLDNEMWHFGSTVGGLHNSLTAYSRGWSAIDHKFKDLFDLVWRDANHA